jgi:cupin fold WbuC family metalloprotein
VLVKLVSQALLDELAAKAAVSPRARAHHNLHASPEDLVQRFLVVARCDSYFRPHRHTSRAELALIVRGRVDLITFDEEGRVMARHAVGEGTGNLAYETAPGTWHTLVAGRDGTAFLEIKQGPYDPLTAAEFAAWAPPEGDARVGRFLAWARRAAPGDAAPTDVAPDVGAIP